MADNEIRNENDLLMNLTKSKEILKMVEDTNYQPKLDIIGDTRVNKINNSKLPEEIKKLMIERPIEQIGLGDGVKLSTGLSDDVLNNARRLMENNTPNQPTQNKPTSNKITQSVNIDQNLIYLIESVIRKVFDEKIKELKGDDFSSINENIALKVGSSVFKGKISSVKQV